MGNDEFEDISHKKNISTQKVNDIPTTVMETNHIADTGDEEANDALMSAIKIAEKREFNRRQSSFLMDPSLDTLNYSPFRRKCHELIHSFKFQAVVIGFVILDCIFVIAELIVDLRITKAEVCDKVTCETIKKDHSLSLVLQSLSLAILTLFIIETLFKLYTLRLDFFRSKMEMFDAVIVGVSWSLDIVFFEHGDETNAITLLIFLRMWRLIRIVHAIAMSMITPVSHKLEEEKNAHRATHYKVKKVSEYSKELEEEIKKLRDLLQNSDCILPETKVKNK